MARYTNRHKRRLVKFQTDADALNLINYAGNDELENFVNLNENQTCNECGSEIDTVSELLLLHQPQVTEDLSDGDGNSLCFSEEVHIEQNIYHSQSKELQTTKLSNNSDVKNPSLQDKLRDWAIQYKIPQHAVSALLNTVLNGHVNVNLPKDCRTLLKTPRNTGTVIEMGHGNYCHFGLTHALDKIFRDRQERHLDLTSIKLLVNVDGLPLFKSSNSSLWPILCSDILIEKVYMIGVFFGKHKPKDSNEFLQKFVSELLPFVENGYVSNTGKVVAVRLFGLICDAPAKAVMY